MSSNDQSKEKKQKMERRLKSQTDKREDTETANELDLKN